MLACSGFITPKYWVGLTQVSTPRTHQDLWATKITDLATDAQSTLHSLHQSKPLVWCASTPGGLSRGILALHKMCTNPASCKRLDDPAGPACEFLGNVFRQRCSHGGAAADGHDKRAALSQQSQDCHPPAHDRLENAGAQSMLRSRGHDKKNEKHHEARMAKLMSSALHGYYSVTNIDRWQSLPRCSHDLHYIFLINSHKHIIIYMLSMNPYILSI